MIPETANFDFRQPVWTDGHAEGLDYIRWNAKFVQLCAISDPPPNGYAVLPGWQTQVDTSTTNDNATPDKWVLTKGSMKIEARFTWSGTRVATVQVCYDNGVEGGLVCFDAVTIIYGFNEPNLIVSSRDLTHASWSTFGSGMTVTFDQTGIDGGANKASNVDDSWTSDTTSSGVSTDLSGVDVSSEGWGTFRIWVKKDATATQGALMYLPFYTEDYGSVSELDVVFSPDTGEYYTTVYDGTVAVEFRSSAHNSDWWEILVEFQIPTDAAARFEPEISPAFIDPYEESPTLPQAVAGNIVVGNVEFFAEVRLADIPNGIAPVYNDP